MPVDVNECELNKKLVTATTTTTATPAGIIANKTIDKKAKDDKNDIKNSETNANTTNNPTKRRIQSMTDDEIIQQNFKDLLELKSREERKANGRLVAVILVFLVLFLAIYHVWIRKTSGFAGVFVPAVIMLSYGGWVVILAKRDKRRQALFKKHLEEIVSKNKTEQEEKAKLKKLKQMEKTTSTLHLENEKSTDSEDALLYGSLEKKPKRQRNKRVDSTISSGYSTLSSTSSNSNASSSVSIGKIRTKRPSIREKLFKQKAAHNVADGMVRAVGPATTIAPLISVDSEGKKKVRKSRLQKFDDMPMLHLSRQGSIP